MIYSFHDLVNTLVIGFSCTTIGYIIGNVRGRMKVRQELTDRIPFLIYNRDS